MKNQTIAVAGHLCVDITPGFPHTKTADKVSQLLMPGKIINVGDASFSAGGAVANTGLALKKLGTPVILMGKIGRDAFGSIIKDTFRGYQADEYLICSEDESSSYTIVIAPPGVDRIFLHNPGCNDTFCMDDLDFDAIGQARHFHFGYPPLMRAMYIDGSQELVNIFTRVKEMGLTTSLDMAAVEDDSEAGQQDWLQIIKNLLPLVDFFVPSIEELGYMLDRDLYEDWLMRAGEKDVTTVLDVEKDIKPLAETLLDLGAKCVLIKCGAPGIYLRTAAPEVMKKIAPEFTSWGDLEYFEKSFVPDRILSGTGAGDTSIAAFLKAALDGYPPKRCMQLAAATGASCITAYDALSGLKPFPELIRRIDGGWEKIS